MLLQRFALRAVLACLVLAIAPACADQIGRASFYGHESGSRRADGKPFVPEQLGAAHWTLPLGTRVRVTDLATGRSVAVPINDRGPHPRLHRLIDLSLGAARALGITRRGVVTVRTTVIG
ncbi:septal ring lytic transglycosylase RlpA family protein [Methylobacterium soli]|uniref:Endolytic peptidoglycan transglycosylase RlpA n=1 Tax=Methylobacterium soli TaxID=553447 RepID=A0A6L3T2H3_9HYPH|nr:septal ring lytic transglycosylase RlpA family protein [Methylobacterium soli]KAB1079326.1 septal ring lytic transglycosylase RlpA family protein [Methylobacterium soli]GJE42972.1 Endolytic peptidoglycan transglycosylase RlpA [Methylobacterium soli]